LKPGKFSDKKYLRFFCRYSWSFPELFLLLHPKKFIANKTMAKKSKDARVQVILECTEHKTSGLPGTSRYISTKNKKNTPERMELKKFNPIMKKMTVHREIK